MQYWNLITRLGEVQILLPAALLAALGLLRRSETRPIALWWIASLGMALLLTTASKVAFIGWGIGWPELNFTGISGHAMVAAAVYPMLLGSWSPQGRVLGRGAAVGAGCFMAILVGVSRIALGAHSISEVLAGLLVGGAASAVPLTLGRLPRPALNPAIPATIALWLVFMPGQAPASHAHSAVTRLSLMLSGHRAPYTRSDMIRQFRSRRYVGEEARIPLAG